VDARHKAGHDEPIESARFHWLHFEYSQLFLARTNA
jgi:hypothetical protein